MCIYIEKGGMARDTWTHATVDLCLGELHRCLRGTIGPKFIGILGDKYGYRPLPTTLSKEQFSCVHTFLEKRGDLDLFTTWYRMDQNSNVYRLQPVMRILPDVMSTNETAQIQATKMWWDVAQPALVKAVFAAFAVLQVHCAPQLETLKYRCIHITDTVKLCICMHDEGTYTDVVEPSGNIWVRGFA